MAEVNWAIYSRSLPKHIPDDDTLFIHVQALTDGRNNLGVSADWQFRTTDARTKLKSFIHSYQID